jgi:hypothetical protein
MTFPPYSASWYCYWSNLGGPVVEYTPAVQKSRFRFSGEQFFSGEPITRAAWVWIPAMCVNSFFWKGKQPSCDGRGGGGSFCVFLSLKKGVYTGGIGEGGCVGIILCLSLTSETWSSTVPPAVALFNYWTQKRKRSCIIFADLFPNWVFSQGFIFILLILPIGTAKAFFWAGQCRGCTASRFSWSKTGARIGRARICGQTPTILNYMTIREVGHSKLFSQSGFFAGFSLCFIIIAGWNSEAAAKGWGGPHSAPFFVLLSFKKQVRKCTAKTR